MPVANSESGAAVMRRPQPPEREKITGTFQTKPCHTLWVPSGPTAVLLRGLSDRLELGWQINHAVRPDLLVLTNLGTAAPEALTARCRPKRAVLCLDDRAGRNFLSGHNLPCFTYSEGRSEADLTAHDLRTIPGGLTFLAVTKSELARVSTPADDLYSALAALACAAALDIPLSSAAGALSALLCGAGKTPLKDLKSL